MSDTVADTEITLHYQDLRLKVSPYGASLRGFWKEDAAGSIAEIATVYTGAKGKTGGQGDVLIPFPGRVGNGTYTFEGQTYEMPRNDKDGPNAIHGFLRLVPWEIREQGESSITFAVDLLPDANPGYPFALRTTVTYSLDENGLTCHFGIENTGEKAAPVAAGFHPYFTVGSDRIDSDELQVPMASTLEFVNLIPTGKVLPVEGTVYDFREPRLIGDTKFNTCYIDPIRDADGRARFRLGDPDTGSAVTVWMDESFPAVVLYSGDPLPESHRRRSLAIEPMTCGSDAFNHPEWGLVSLAPGATFSGTWGVTPTDLAHFRDEEDPS